MYTTVLTFTARPVQNVDVFIGTVQDDLLKESKWFCRISNRLIWVIKQYKYIQMAIQLNILSDPYYTYLSYIVYMIMCIMERNVIMKH